MTSSRASKRRAWLVLMAVAAALFGPAVARSDDQVRLSLGSKIGSTTVGGNGTFWYSSTLGSRAGIGRIVGDTALFTPFPELETYTGGGYIVRRPDGRVWVLLDARTVLRENPDGTFTRFGPLPVALDTLTPAYATDASNALIVAKEPRSIIRIADDGGVTIRRFEPPVASADAVRCFFTDMAITQSGAIYLADYGCDRIVRVDPDTSAHTITTDPEAPGESLSPSSLLLTADDTLWFTAYGRRAVIGRFNPDGTVTRVGLPAGNSATGDLVMGPGGDIWLPADCQLARIVGDQVSFARVGFPASELSFAPDGRAWVAGYTRAVRGAPAALPSAAEACDTRAPRLSVKSVRRLSIRRLRRTPRVRLTVDESSWVEGSVLFTYYSKPGNFGDIEVDRVVHVRGKRASISVKLPAKFLRAAARHLRRGDRPTLTVLVDAIDSSGNFGYPNGDVGKSYELRP